MLRFEGVTYTYPASPAGVFDITMEIAPGELVAVIGASGSGKSTLLKVLAGFLVPEAGRVRIDGADVTELPPERRHLGVVFQSYALFPHMQAWENVAYPLKLRGLGPAERRRRALEALARVGMAEQADRAPSMLSGGQQQRVALARALVFSPRGLLLDEPLSALDAGLRLEMRDEILRVQREAGIATLLVTHDQEEALSIADRVAVVREGRLVQIATPHVLYDDPADAAVAHFVGQSNLWTGRVESDGRVATPVGALACDTSSFAQGAEVTVFVRPERVLPLIGLPSAGANVFSGTPSADRFLGAIRRIDLKVGQGLIRLETHLRGDVTAVAIPPDAVRLLPAAGPKASSSTTSASTTGPSEARA